MISALIAGLIFGLTAGFSPGPLMTLIVTQTLRHGAREGVLVALAPLITDVPIIMVSLFVLTKLANFELVLGVIALIGGIYVLYLGYETLRTGPVNMSIPEVHPRSLGKGAIINALNPHPYMFWGAVGGPFILRSAQNEPLAPWLFVGCFYFLLVGAKVFVALLVGKFRMLLT